MTDFKKLSTPQIAQLTKIESEYIDENVLAYLPKYLNREVARSCRRIRDMAEESGDVTMNRPPYDHSINIQS